MRKILMAIALCSALSCHAAPPSEESLDTLFALTKAESMLDAVHASVEQHMRVALAQAAAGKTLTAKQQRFFDEWPKRSAEVIREELSWASMKPVLVQIYQETFTQEEIDGLIDFYRSAVGRTFIEKMPVVMQKSTLLMQSRIQPLAAKMKAAAEEALREANIDK
ncbi:MAG TPA: DUF2059 domain-containing protein [Burkholderiales bacterium]|nr:DUF2059 domain-containing protein [Burkholderiales bacterium]